MWKAIAAGIAAAGAGCLLRSEYEKNHFVVEETVFFSTKLRKEKRMVFLTDIHDKEFGPGNEKLLRAVEAIRPDAILIGGDMMVSKEEGCLDITFRLLENLAELGPVFYSLGNHEMRLGLETWRYGTKYQELLDRAGQLGVTMLIDQTAEFQEDIAITGVNLSQRYYEKLFFRKPPVMTNDYLEEKLGRADRERYQILLMHSPLYFEAGRRWGADLILAGHFHGGTIRIPGAGGLMTPQYQFFLPWCAGDFEENGSRMLVGRGLGTHSINIRLNDRPQLPVLRLMPEGTC